MRRRSVALAILLLLCLTPIAQAQDRRCFVETGQCISGRIRQFWEQNGGLPVFGFPTTNQHEEQIEGKPFQVQWFERNRLELHPENARPYDVLLGRLGVDRLVQQGRDWNTFDKVDPNTPHYFPETGHAIASQFWGYWSSHGLEFDGQAGKSFQESLALFGMPLSEAVMEKSATDGNTYLTQHFERARFELHPENQPPYNVLLGLLGNEIRQTTPARTPTIVEITEDNYEAEVLRSPLPVLLDFWAEWSGPSRAIAPALERIARKYAGRVKVGKINVDDSPKLTDQFSITKIPTFIVIKDGSEQQRIAGPTSEESISQMLDAQLGDSP